MLSFAVGRAPCAFSHLTLLTNQLLQSMASRLIVVVVFLVISYAVLKCTQEETMNEYEVTHVASVEHWALAC